MIIRGNIFFFPLPVLYAMLIDQLVTSSNSSSVKLMVSGSKASDGVVPPP
jgi:hypothetical protein